MKFNLSDSEYNQLTKLVIEPLKKSGLKVYIFGSRARGNSHPFSDIDILYSYENIEPEFNASISQIKEAVEESNFPFKVDLVNEKDLAASYRESVFKERVLI